MRDIRISIRLNQEEHQKFKIMAIKNKTTMQKLLLDYVKAEIKKEDKKNDKKD